MIEAWRRTAEDCFTPEFRAVMARALGASAVAFALVGWGAIWAVDRIAARWEGWLGSAIALLGNMAALALAVMAFPILARLAAALFADDIALAIERRRYPGDPPGRPESALEALGRGLRDAGFALAINAAALPLYLIPGLNLALYLAINGVLIARDFHDGVARRYLSREEVVAARKRHRGILFIHGMFLSMVFAVPIVNIAAPILATALMTNVFKMLCRDTKKGLGAGVNLAL